MTRRRTVLIGLGSAALGGGIVTAGSLATNVAASADLRVAVESEIAIQPARQNPQYVRQQDGELEIVITQLNQRARTTFADLLQLTNTGDQRYEAVQCRFRGADGESDAATDPLGIVATNGVVDLENGYALQLPGNELEPGDTTTFGVVVDLLETSESLPTGTTVSLQLSTTEATGG